MVAQVTTSDQPIELAPRSTYEVVTRERVEHMAADLAEVRDRINTLFYLVIGSIITDVLLRIML